MSEFKLVPCIKRPMELEDFREKLFLEQYKRFKSRNGKGFDRDEALHAFEMALIILGYEIKEVE